MASARTDPGKALIVGISVTALPLAELPGRGSRKLHAWERERVLGGWLPLFYGDSCLQGRKPTASAGAGHARGAAAAQAIPNPTRLHLSTAAEYRRNTAAPTGREVQATLRRQNWSFSGRQAHVRLDTHIGSNFTGVADVGERREWWH